ncbi:DUF3833 domain-containing protein [Crenobacter sp. SG2305]|uniref:DUF3833 domain-containing protein n=1 Tax=Crenobacter oryzisoli TaxID=3056844 RepID=UPI0025AADF4B|nr:DUF3833 domain-containing protein [Crenobacter sp. SG2305]MDN0082834.1 DUF3833 domain-containing protein [Crenobacter sp. SG2305]
MKRSAVLLGVSMLLGACVSPDVSHYRNEQPAFDPASYFVGTTDAWGMFQKRSGEVVKRFRVVVKGRLDDGRLILDESFRYSDGSTQRRVWALVKQPDGRWQGTAGDVVGVARGEGAGNALHWQYTLRLPVDGSEYEVAMDDWMYLIDADTLVNRTRMSKLGFELGNVTLFFRKRQKD